MALTLKRNQESWENLFDAILIDDKVDAFTMTLINILDTTMSMKTIRTHPSDKAWITLQIKLTIKERQRAYTKGDQLKYQVLRCKVSGLIATAKTNYYNNNAAGLRKTDTARWHNEINTLTGASCSSQSTQIPPLDGNLNALAYKMQKAFTSIWDNLTSTVPSESPAKLRDVPPLKIKIIALPHLLHPF